MKSSNLAWRMDDADAAFDPRQDSAGERPLRAVQRPRFDVRDFDIRAFDARSIVSRDPGLPLFRVR